MKVVRMKNSDDECIWVDDVHPIDHSAVLLVKTGEILSLDMSKDGGAERVTGYLDKERAAELVAHLQAWLATGSMKLPKKTYSTEELAIANGFRGTCKVCGKVFKVRVPRAKFHPGDGTVRLMFVHNNDAGQTCEGSGAPAKEWDF